MPDEIAYPVFSSPIKGYLSDEEGKALFDLVLKIVSPSPVLEIGSFCGKSTIYIGTACKTRGLTLFTIDHHMGSEEQQPGQLYFDEELFDDRKGRIDSLPLLLETLKTLGLKAPLCRWSHGQKWLHKTGLRPSALSLSTEVIAMRLPYGLSLLDTI